MQPPVEPMDNLACSSCTLGKHSFWSFIYVYTFMVACIFFAIKSAYELIISKKFISIHLLIISCITMVVSQVILHDASARNHDCNTDAIANEKHKKASILTFLCVAGYVSLLSASLSQNASSFVMAGTFLIFSVTFFVYSVIDGQNSLYVCEGASLDGEADTSDDYLKFTCDSNSSATCTRLSATKCSIQAKERKHKAFSVVYNQNEETHTCNTYKDLPEQPKISVATGECGNSVYYEVSEKNSAQKDFLLNSSVVMLFASFSILGGGSNKFSFVALMLLITFAFAMNYEFVKGDLSFVFGFEPGDGKHPSPGWIPLLLSVILVIFTNNKGIRYTIYLLSSIIFNMLFLAQLINLISGTTNFLQDALRAVFFLLVLFSFHDATLSKKFIMLILYTLCIGSTFLPISEDLKVTFATTLSVITCIFTLPQVKNKLKLKEANSTGLFMILISIFLNINLFVNGDKSAPHAMISLLVGLVCMISSQLIFGEYFYAFVPLGVIPFITLYQYRQADYSSEQNPTTSVAAPSQVSLQPSDSQSNESVDMVPKIGKCEFSQCIDPPTPVRMSNFSDDSGDLEELKQRQAIRCREHKQKHDAAKQAIAEKKATPNQKYCVQYHENQDCMNVCKQHWTHSSLNPAAPVTQEDIDNMRNRLEQIDDSILHLTPDEWLSKHQRSDKTIRR